MKCTYWISGFGIKIKEYICKHLEDNKAVSNSQHRFVKNNYVESIQFSTIPRGREKSEICSFPCFFKVSKTVLGDIIIKVA